MPCSDKGSAVNQVEEFFSDGNITEQCRDDDSWDNEV